MKSKSIPNPFARKIAQCFKVNSTEMKEILGKAVKYNHGNVSAYLREAALKYRRRAKKK